MGGDGGLVPQRADIVKTAGYGFLRSQSLGGMGYQANTIVRKSDDSVSQKDQKRFRMMSCRLSNDLLETPIVADRLGNLYNKEAVVQKLVSKQMPDIFLHISKLKDIKEVKVTSIHKDKEGVNHVVCPVMNKELDDGITKSVLLWNCGCIISNKAIQALTVKKKTNNSSSINLNNQTNVKALKFDTIDQQSLSAAAEPCPVCSMPDSLGGSSLMIPLAPDQEEFQKLEQQLPEKIKQKRSELKKKLLKEIQEETGGQQQVQSETGTESRTISSGQSQGHGSYGSRPSGPKYTNTNSTDFNSLKRNREPQSDETQTENLHGNALKKVKPYNSNQDVDSSKSDVYKSLFRPASAQGSLGGQRDGFGTSRR